MFTAITFYQKCRSELNPREPLSCPKKTLLITEIALSVIAISVGVCFMLVARFGVNLGPLNAIGMMPRAVAGLFLSLGSLVLCADIVTAVKHTIRYYQLSS